MNYRGRGRNGKNGIARPGASSCEILRHHYLAPHGLDENGAIIQEAIEEQLDGINYLTREVARLEDLRRRLSRSEGDGGARGDGPSESILA